MQAASAPQERIIGLLNLPEIVGDGCGPAKPGSADLHSRASADSPVTGSLRYRVSDRQADGRACGSARLDVRRPDGTGEEDLPTLESEYEIAAAIVHERSGQWFRIARRQGSAWIRREHMEDFKPYPELLTETLAYLRPGWDGQLWRSPDLGPARVPPAWTQYLDQEVTVDVLEIRRTSGDVWLHVRLKTDTCGGTLPNVEEIAGWVRGYRVSGVTSAWFFSRGC
ncbi:MAG: hypothetical protein V7647_1182 [Acidobacteriota bacterium]